MKRIHLWTLLGVAGAGLLAALLGPTVLGQPEPKVPFSLPPELMAPPKGMPDAPAVEAMLPELKSGDVPMTVADPPQPVSLPQIIRTETVAQTVPSSHGIKRGSGATVALSSAENEVLRQRDSAASLNESAGKQQPAVSIEWVGPTDARIRQPMPCQILVRNASSVPAQNVIVRHRLGQGVVVKACEPKAANENGELVWNLGTLAPEQTLRIDLTLVSQTRGAMNCHASVTSTAVAGHQVQVREPLLAVVVRAPEKAEAGETVTLQCAVSNPGDGVAEQVKLKVMLPEGLEHPRGKVVEFDIGNVAPSELRTVPVSCIAKATGPQNCTIVASADGNLTCKDTARFEIMLRRLDIALAGPKLRYLYRHAVYTLTVTNPGKIPAANIEVHEVVPAGFRVHQAQGAKYHEGTGLISWSIGELQPGQSKDFAVDLIPIKIGEHHLIAHAKPARGLKTEGEMRTLVEGLPSLEIEVNHLDDPIEVGAETAFEIRVANKGTEAENNIEVVCTLPDQLEFVGARCTTTLRYRQEGHEVIFEKMPRLAPRAEEIFRVQVKGVAPGDIRFRTRIRADGLVEPVQREESMRIYSDEAPQKHGLSNRPIDASRPMPPTGPPTPSPLPLPAPAMPMFPAPANPAPGSPLPTPLPAPAAPIGLPPPTPLPAPAAPIGLPPPVGPMIPPPGPSGT
jgi:uncharacterized repeat protein (TIGR01451 family)